MGIGVLMNRIRALVYKSCYNNLTIGKNVQIEGKIEVMRGGRISVGNNTCIRRWVC